MKDLEKLIHIFMDECKYMKGLNDKTLKAYSIDLKQYVIFCTNREWCLRETV